MMDDFLVFSACHLIFAFGYKVKRGRCSLMHEEIRRGVQVLREGEQC